MKLLSLALCAGLISSIPAVSAAKDHAPPRVGFVAGAGGYPKMAITNQTFFDALSEAGYQDGSTMQVIFRTAEGNMGLMPQLIQEVLADKPDYLVVSSSPGCSAAQKATTTIPVLCISVQDDPIKEGLTPTLAHGNGNLVGVHSYLENGIAEQLGMLKKLKPELQKIGVLFNPNNATHQRLLSDWQRTAKHQGLQILPMPAATAADLDAVVQKAKADQVNIAIGLLGADTYAMRAQIAEVAKAHALPIAMDTPGGYPEMGGVAAIGVDIVPLYRQGALELMVPMLKGTAPAELPWIGPKEIAIKTNDASIEYFKLSQPD